MTGGAGAEVERWAHGVLVAATAGTLAPPDWLLRRADAGLGGICLFGRNVVDAAQVRTFTDAVHARRADLLVAVDEEGGDVTRLHRTAGSPHLGHLALGAVDDPELTRSTAAAIGRELSEAGIDWDFAPVADVNAAPDSPVIGVRSFGSDPGRVGGHVAAYTQGLAEAGVASCAKHFPGHGATSADSHTDLPRIRIDRATLEAVHLPPFAAAVAAGVDTVMVGHLLVDCLDEALPTSLSPAAMSLLRAELGFDGVVVTDALDMDAVATRWTVPGSAVLAVAAGADAVCLAGGLFTEDVVRACVDALVGAVRDGRLPADRLAEAAHRVARFGARQARRRDRDRSPGGTPPVVGVDAGRRVTADAADADRSLRVHGDPVLPPGPVDLVAFEPPPNIAAGRATWNPAVALAALRPGSRVQHLPAPSPSGTPADTAPGTLTDPGRHILAVVRDLHRHPWARARLDQLLRARPDTVVVELGVPVRNPGGRGWVCTHGSGAASVAAAARALGLV